jgi:beta-lactamase superfamily II metal-dependent hydrolase
VKLTVFQSGKGDCLLLTGEDDRRILIDGGTQPSYSMHVAPALAKLRDEGEMLDVIYLSHIDDDHIGGVLRLMDDEVDWRVHEYQLKHNNLGHKAPNSPRPPEVKEIWHNAFQAQIPKNTGQIEDLLAASAAIYSGSTNEQVAQLAGVHDALATSIRQGIELTRRVGPAQLGIRLNAPAKGKLMLVRGSTGTAIRRGKMKLYIIGPFAADLTQLRKEWDSWLEKNKTALKDIEQQDHEDEAQLESANTDALLNARIKQAETLSQLLSLDVSAREHALGERSKLTTPNLASLMLYVEERGKTLLLTGDGHYADILRGLKHIGKLREGKGLHVDVLKVQHHGSESNIKESFCRTITADNYVFCGNGEHQNPETRVLQAIADSRLGSGPQLSPNPEASKPFKFWFNSHSTVSHREDARAHMAAVQTLVNHLSIVSNGKLRSFFLKGSNFELQL